MATAERVIHTIETITLDLTPKEAGTLAVVLARVGGDPVNSPRKHIRSINGALSSARVGFSTGEANSLVYDGFGAIYFHDYRKGDE